MLSVASNGKTYYSLVTGADKQVNINPLRFGVGDGFDVDVRLGGRGGAGHLFPQSACVVRAVHTVVLNFIRHDLSP